MPDLTRYDKFLTHPGVSKEQWDAALQKMHTKFRAPDAHTLSGGNLGRVSPRLSKHHRIVIGGIRIKK